RKVDTFNEAYRLREKGAVRNWFDITEKDGYCSLNTKISDIMATLHGKLVLMFFIASKLRGIKKKKDDGNPASGMAKNPQIMKMIGSFTPLRASSMAGTIGLTFTKDELLKLNGRLNKVKLRNSK
ncbi:MAG: hypothetical protein ACI4NM_09985, partial [Bullifex sp.]